MFAIVVDLKTFCLKLFHYVPAHKLIATCTYAPIIVSTINVTYVPTTSTSKYRCRITTNFPKFNLKKHKTSHTKTNIY